MIDPKILRILVILIKSTVTGNQFGFADEVHSILHKYIP